MALNLTKFKGFNEPNKMEKTMYAQFFGLKTQEGALPKYDLAEQAEMVAAFTAGEKQVDEEAEDYVLRVETETATYAKQVEHEQVTGKVTLAVVTLWPSEEIAKTAGIVSSLAQEFQVFANHDVDSNGNIIGSAYDAIKVSIDKFYPSWTYEDALD